MSWEHDTASGFLDLLKRLNAFLLKGHNIPPVYTGSGDGRIDNIIGTSASVQETITITFTGPTAFNVAGSVTGALAAGTVGTDYTSSVVNFLVSQGSTQWQSGDTISFVMTPPYESQSDVVSYASSSVYSDTARTMFAFDGDANTYWGTDNLTLTGTLEVEFGSAHEIVQYALQMRGDVSAPTTCPAAWTLEYYDENTSAWVVGDTQTGQTAWSQGQRRYFTLAASITAKRFRINITANNGSTVNTTVAGFGLYETLLGPNVAYAGCIWKAPGNANMDDIYFGVYPYYHVATDYYNWRLGAFVGFTSGLTFANQLGAMTVNHLFLTSGNIPYWFIADGAHVAIVAAVGTVYESGYMGFIDKYMNPGAHPYPLFIGGSARFSTEPATTSTSWRWSYTGNEHSAFWKGLNGSSSPLLVRKMDGTWKTFQGGTAEPDGGLWPFVSGPISFTYTITNMDGTYPLFPIIPNEQTAQYGELTGVAAVPGYLQSAENIILSNRERWLVVPNIYRSDRSDFAAFRLV